MPKVKRHDSSDDSSSSGSESDTPPPPPPKKVKQAEKEVKGKGKKKQDSSSDSGPDDIEPSPKASSAGKSSSTSSSKGEDNTWTLERNRLVKISEFRGRLSVDIREYYEKDGKLLPGKKGISLNPTQWQKFKQFIPEIDEALKKF